MHRVATNIRNWSPSMQNYGAVKCVILYVLSFYIKQRKHQWMLVNCNSTQGHTRGPCMKVQKANLVNSLWNNFLYQTTRDLVNERMVCNETVIHVPKTCKLLKVKHWWLT